MRSRIQRRGHTFSADDVAGRAHRTWDDAEHADTGWRRSLSMHDDFTFRPIREPMPFAPGKVVMILDVEPHLDAQRMGHGRVNQRVIIGADVAGSAGRSVSEFASLPQMERDAFRDGSQSRGLFIGICAAGSRGVAAEK
jgi:hypothetical protein